MKRKLSQQQKRRIERRQQTRRERAVSHTPSAEGPEHTGVIVAHYGQQLAVLPHEGEQAGSLLRAYAKANVGELVAGDEVIWCPADDGKGVIVARRERSSELRRPDNFGNLKAVAANIDQVVLVIAPEPQPHDNLIDRYLAAAEINNLPAVILLNKADLISEYNCEALESLLARYQRLGYPVLRTSAMAPESPDVTELLSGRTSIFAGQSGVGKSSLVQQLLPEETLRVGALSDSGKGTHTTTTAYRYALPSGGAIVDSPGIREFGLWHLSPEQLTEGFVDIREFASQCRFRDCRHQQEPGCALKAAVEQGHLAPERLHSFRRIQYELEQQSRG